ncbi:MAG: hypothetical protein K2Y09_01625 [Nitrosomonas sp.]|uniref:M12 family metallopeptidase n=1 Tax=Nitrosomonas sp. TaxID=42353 RepID=UPI001D1FE18C|nr:M12 family metallopeptidase [Nitrosomonas sp.]MBX9893870.1 hypothetical protein [Nitrosomonas sp.]
MNKDENQKIAQFCRIAQAAQRSLPAGLNQSRVRLIQLLADKWVNGTVLRYCFVDKGKFQQKDGSWKEYQWSIPDADAEVVRQGFSVWKDVGIGLEFQEVSDRRQADIRIGFLRGDGAWSYIGKQIRQRQNDEITMNFGWDISDDIDTAVHEIGHTLGFPHEHQNPNAGIIWDEEAVYRALAAPPNEWDRETTFYNIIRKISPDSVQGSSWDPDSIMHYPFGPGLIKEPAQYRNGLTPAPGLSSRDVKWVRTFYPPLAETDPMVLQLYKSHAFDISPGQQVDFKIEPEATHQANIRTYGESDTVMVLFEQTDKGSVFVAGDDDSGLNTNASLSVPLIAGRKYFVRIRLYYSASQGSTVVMYS